MTTPLAHRFMESTLHCPSQLKTIPQSTLRQTEASFPLRQVCSDALVRGEHSFPRVAVLLSISGPATIFRRVRTVVVNAVQRVAAIWARPHVGVEGFKRVKPALTNRNASSAVIGVALPSWVEATLSHRAPGVVLRSRRTRSGMAMFAFGWPAMRDPRAAAGLCGTTFQCAFLQHSLCPAIASAEPKARVLIAFSLSNNGPQTATFINAHQLNYIACGTT